MPELRVVIRETYERLFPEAEIQEAETAAMPSDAGDEEERIPPAKKLNYGEQVSKMFDDALKNSLVVKKVC